MAAIGFTPIQLFRTTTASATPSAPTLADGELAINLTDEKLYFKNAAGVVKLLAANVTPVANGGTGVTTSTGTGSVVLNTSPTLVTPTLGVASATSLNVSGTITGTAITQSAIDTTSGRLTRVGDFGLGSTSQTLGVKYSGISCPIAPDTGGYLLLGLVADSTFRIFGKFTGSRDPSFNTGERFAELTVLSSNRNDGSQRTTNFNLTQQGFGSQITVVECTYQGQRYLAVEALGTFNSWRTRLGFSGYYSKFNDLQWVEPADVSSVTAPNTFGPVRNEINGHQIFNAGDEDLINSTSNQLFGTNGSERMRIDSNGKLLSPGGSAFFGTVATGSTNGAIMERGSNANGEFIRFADGTQICRGDVSLTFPANSEEADDETVTFPASFSATPDIQIAFARNGYFSTSGKLLPFWGNRSTTSFVLRSWNLDPSSSSQSRFHGWVAIGRWY